MSTKSRVTIAALIASAGLLTSIATMEGFSDKAYPDPVHGWDVPTIGHGTTAGVKQGDTITPEEAKERLRMDVNQFEGEDQALHQRTPLPTRIRCLCEPCLQHRNNQVL